MREKHRDRGGGTNRQGERERGGGRREDTEGREREGANP